MAERVQVVVPTGQEQLNEFATQRWWESAEPAEGVRHDVSADGDHLLTWGGPRPVRPDSDRVLLVVTPVRTWLPTEPAAARSRLERLADDVLRHTSRARVALAIRATPPSSVAELLAAAAGLRWPLVDPAADPETGAAIDPAVAPDVRRFAELLADELASQADRMVPPSAVTRALGVADAVESLSFSVDASGEVPADQAHELRAATRDALDRLQAAGVRVSGPRDALLWPLPTTAGRLPTELAARAALAVMHGAVERTDPLSAGLDPRMAEIDRLEERLRRAGAGAR